MARNKRITVSDVLKDHMHKWQRGDIITIEAGTGVGKSHFIKNGLYPVAKEEGSKILFLLNRTRLNEQFQKEIERDCKTDVITIRLYQKYEWELIHNNVVVNEEYKYLVCDEFHYFLTESKFNENTEDSFNAIIKEKNKIRIFMSATADAMISYLKFKNIEHESHSIPHDYSHIKELIFYKNDKVLEKFLGTVPKNKKAICFNKSSAKGLALHETFKNSLFVCSDSGTTKEKKYVDKDKVMNMLTEEKFAEKFLFTTSTLDNGVNLKDRAIKYVIADIGDVDTLIQCLGRKRIIDKRDKVTVIIKDISDKMINKLIRDCEIQINPAIYLKENGAAEYVKKYKKKTNNKIVYDCLSDDETGYKKTINELRFFKENYDKELYESMLLEENGYMNYIQSKLQQQTYTVLDDTYEKVSLSDFLDTLINKRLYKEDQDKLVKKIGLRDGRKRLQKSAKSLNVYFSENEIPYVISYKNRDKRRTLSNGQPNPNHDKYYWVI
ncbi:DEAD/DEAH box helicase family protein, partial [Paenibacillus polymyxa]